MALVVIDRPAKEIDGDLSAWNALNLPVQYKFSSDLFPLNSSDPIIPSSTLSNNGGFLQVNLAFAPSNINVGEYVLISGANIDTYNGIFRVKEILFNSNIVLFVSFDSDLTISSLQKYYNNYFVEVRVFSGLPDSHPSHSIDPIQEVGILRVVPDGNNQIVASFSGILKDSIKFTKKLGEGIDLDHFTGFYVEFREGYDQNVNGIIETFYTPWVADIVGDCGDNIVTNGTFDTDLSGWLQIGNQGVPSEPFFHNPFGARSNLNTFRKTNIIYQEVDIVSDVTYNINMDVMRTNARFSKFLIQASNDLINFTLIHIDSGTSASVNINLDFTLSNNFKYIGFSFCRDVTPVFTTLTIDNVVLTPVVCEFTFWGSNSSRQFQDQLGGNMFANTSGRGDSSFMTNFAEPTLFKGNYYDLSIIINDNSISDFDISEDALMWLNGDDLPDSGLIDDWVDRTGNHTVTSSGDQRPQVDNFGVNNKRGAAFNGATLQRLNVSQMSIDQSCVLYAVFRSTNVDIRPIISDNNGASLFVNSSDISAFAGTSFGNVPSPSNTDYVVKVVFNGGLTQIYVNNVLSLTANIGLAGFNSSGYSIGFQSTGSLEGIINEVIILSYQSDPCLLWQTESYLSSKYETYIGSDIGFSKTSLDESGSVLSIDNGYIPYEGKGLYRIPVFSDIPSTKLITYRLIGSSSCLLSEDININVDDYCSQQDIYMTWLNSSGGWDYWKFTAEKNYNIDIDSKETIKRNIFSNWDSDFINGNTESDVISVNANRSIDVFSQYLNDDEIEAVGAIKYSTKVMMFDAGNLLTVIVDSSNVLLYNDGEDDTLHTIQFNIRLADIQTQSQ